jgi:hypothetical protein
MDSQLRLFDKDSDSTYGICKADSIIILIRAKSVSVFELVGHVLGYFKLCQYEYGYALHNKRVVFLLLFF